MTEKCHVAVSIPEQAKIQAQVLVPLVRALQAELGEERANALVRRALGDVYRRNADEFRRAKTGQGLDDGVSVCRLCARRREYRVMAQSVDRFELDVTRCRYAEFFQALGVPELGFLLVCSADYAVAEGFGSDVALTRSQTLMQGASHCDFRYRRATGTD